MQIIRRANHHRIYVVFLFEEFAEVGVRCAPVILPRALLRGIEGIHDLLGWLTPRHSAGHFQ